MAKKRKWLVRLVRFPSLAVSPQCCCWQGQISPLRPHDLLFVANDVCIGVTI